MILLVAMTGRAASLMICLLPCGGASTIVADHVAAATSHCGTHTSEAGLSDPTACQMVHDDTEPAALRTAERLPLTNAPAHASVLPLAAGRLVGASLSVTTLLLDPRHSPPGKPLPLRV